VKIGDVFAIPALAAPGPKAAMGSAGLAADA
jgi:hypothetical protein